MEQSGIKDVQGKQFAFAHRKQRGRDRDGADDKADDNNSHNKMLQKYAKLLRDKKTLAHTHTDTDTRTYTPV